MLFDVPGITLLSQSVSIPHSRAPKNFVKNKIRTSSNWSLLKPTTNHSYKKTNKPAATSKKRSANVSAAKYFLARLETAFKYTSFFYSWVFYSSLENIANSGIFPCNIPARPAELE